MDRCRAAVLWDEANTALRCMNQAKEAGAADDAQVWMHLLAGICFDWVEATGVAK